MAIRLQQTIYSASDEQAWTFSIHDADHVGASTNIDITAAQIQVQSDRDMFAPILSSVVSLSFRITNVSLQTFVDDFLGAAERRFRLEVRKGADLYGNYLILTDDVQQQDKEYPYTFSIKATDGLATLKDVDYNDAGTAYTGRETIHGHILNCLNKLGTDDLFTTTLFSTSVNWFAQEHTATTIDPMLNMRIHHRRFISIDSRGAQEFDSCFEVLKSCCEALGARLILTDGTFRFIQVNEYEGGNLKFFNYNAAGSLVSTTASTSYRTTDGTDVIRLYGGNFRALPSLKRCIVRYTHFQTQSVVTPNGLVFADTDYEEIDSGGGTSKFLLSFQGNVKASYSVPSNFNPLRLLLRIKIKVGSNYLKRTGSVVAGTDGFSYSEMTWESTESFFEVFTPVLATNNVSQIFSLNNVLTPAIPADGTLTINGRYYTAYDTTGSTVTPDDVTVSFLNARFEVVPLGVIEDRANETRYITENSATDNTNKKEYDLKIGDGPSTNALGALQVYDGSGWVASSGWAVGATNGSTAIGQLLAQEVVSTQTKPAEIINAQYKRTYTPLQVVLRESKDHIFLNGTIDIVEGKTQGQWVRLDSTSGSTIDKDEENVFEPDKGGLSVLIPRDVEDVVVKDPDSPFQAVVNNLRKLTALSADLSIGSTITSIPIDALGEDGLINNGDEIRIINKNGGDQIFSVTSDVAAADTSISVSSTTVNHAFDITSIITVDDTEILKKIDAAGGITDVTVGTGLDVSGTDTKNITLDFSELSLNAGYDYNDEIIGIDSVGTQSRSNVLDMFDNVLTAGTNITLSNTGTAIQISASSGMDNFNIQADGGTTTSITDNETINFDAGTNMTITRSGNTLTFAASGGSYTSWTVRGDDGGTQSITNGYTLDVNGGNGIRTRVTGGDLDILLDGSQLLTGFGIDETHELWVFDGSSVNQRYTLDDIVTTGLGGASLSSGTFLDTDQIISRRSGTIRYGTFFNIKLGLKNDDFLQGNEPTTSTSVPASGDIFYYWDVSLSAWRGITYSNLKSYINT